MQCTLPAATQEDLHTSQQLAIRVPDSNIPAAVCTLTTVLMLLEMATHSTVRDIMANPLYGTCTKAAQCGLRGTRSALVWACGA